MVLVCSVCGEKTSKGVSQHYFPLKSSQEIIEKWIKACGKSKSWQINKRYFVCGNHFAPEDYSENGTEKYNCLKKNSHPTINIKPSCTLLNT
jgi:hypothetical protein